MKSKSIVILTGAGISAESGVRTFRDSNGLWENHRIEDVASPAGFVRNPKLVQRFYNARRAQLKTVQPNDAHKALARLEREWRGPFLLVTQNVDDLHERAGSQNLVHMHGSLLSALCVDCEQASHWSDDLNETSRCPNCKASSKLRPDIVWFGEMPYHMEQIGDALETADLLVSIGTSGVVYPAAGFAQQAHRASRYEINMTETEISHNFHIHRVGPASREVPKLVNELLAEL